MNSRFGYFDPTRLGVCACARDGRRYERCLLRSCEMLSYFRPPRDYDMNEATASISRVADVCTLIKTRACRVRKSSSSMEKLTNNRIEVSFMRQEFTDATTKLSPQCIISRLGNSNQSRGLDE